VGKAPGLPGTCPCESARDSLSAAFLEDDEERRAGCLAEVEAYEF
jgi:adenosine deaminase